MYTLVEATPIRLDIITKGLLKKTTGVDAPGDKERVLSTYEGKDEVLQAFITCLSRRSSNLKVYNDKFSNDCPILVGNSVNGDQVCMLKRDGKYGIAIRLKRFTRLLKTYRDARGGEQEATEVKLHKVPRRGMSNFDKGFARNGNIAEIMS